MTNYDTQTKLLQQKYENSSDISLHLKNEGLSVGELLTWKEKCHQKATSEMLTFEYKKLGENI